MRLPIPELQLVIRVTHFAFGREGIRLLCPDAVGAGLEVEK